MNPAVGHHGGVLNGRVAVITGAARGLGEGLALRLAGHGARVVCLGLEPDRLAQVAERCGDGDAWFEVDVTDSAALDRIAGTVLERYGRVDILVCNAGIAAGGPLLLADPEGYDRVIEVNLLGSVRTARAFLPALIDSRGYLLQIASLAALVPGPLMSAYCASKSGVEAFAHALRGEVAHHGVDVAVAYLSWIDTEMVRGADRYPAIRDSRRELPAPFNRTYPVDLAADGLAAGVLRRAIHIYVPGWVRLVPLARVALPAIAAWLGRRRMPKAEQAVRAAGVQATIPVGAGGAADNAARRRPDAEPQP